MVADGAFKSRKTVVEATLVARASSVKVAMTVLFPSPAASWTTVSVEPLPTMLPVTLEMTSPVISKETLLLAETESEAEAEETCDQLANAMLPSLGATDFPNVPMAEAPELLAESTAWTE